MTTDDKCWELRADYDRSNTTGGAFVDHVAGCNGCMQWKKEVDAIDDATHNFVQFDVPESLTQRITAQIAQEPAHSGQGLLVITCVLCCLALCVIYPVDNLEGMLSTALSIACLFVLKLFICGVRSEDLTQS